MAKIPSQKEFEIALRVQAYQELFGYKFTDWHAKDVEIQIPGEGRYWVPIKDIYNTIKNFEEKKKLPEGVDEIKKVIREEIQKILKEDNFERRFQRDWKAANLTKDEILFLNHLFEHYTKSGPVPDAADRYIYINPVYAVKILNKALSRSSLTSSGRLTAQSILAKLRKVGY